VLKNLTQGDALEWKEPAITAKDGYIYTASNCVLTCSLAGPATALNLTAKDSGTETFLFQITTEQSLNLAVGHYFWSYRAAQNNVESRMDGAQTLAGGRLQVLPNLAQQTTGYDGRSFAEKTLDAVNSALANLSAGGLKSYTLGSRTFTYRDIADLMKLRDTLLATVANERRKEARKLETKARAVYG